CVTKMSAGRVQCREEYGVLAAAAAQLQVETTGAERRPPDQHVRGIAGLDSALGAPYRADGMQVSRRCPGWRISAVTRTYRAEHHIRIFSLQRCQQLREPVGLGFLVIV